LPRLSLWLELEKLFLNLLIALVNRHDSIFDEYL
jgi:hypothetical protein